MFSALHSGGRRLHELARAGIEVERAPRRVRIDALELLDWTPPRLGLRVACGKGTYVRSLADDLGEALGCGGPLDALVRTRLGPFTLADAAPGPPSGRATRAARRRRVPTDRAVGHLPAVRLEPAEADRLRHGQALAGRAGAPGPCRLYAGRAFVGIGEADGERLRPLRLLNADHPSPRPVPR